MKVLMTICVSFALAHGACGQTNNYGRTLEQTVKTIMGGMWDGWATKQMWRAGDGTAVALTKVISGKDLTNDEIERASDILDASFGNLSWVETPYDREPLTTLFVLRYLECATQNAPLKSKIAAARKHILEEIAAPAKPE